MLPKFSMKSNAPLLFDLRNVGRKWGEQQALDGVTVSISAGETIVLAGPSGSGKSSLLSILGGALRATSGSTLVEGEEVNDWSAGALRRHRARCSNILSTLTLVPQLTVHGNVVAGLLPNWPWYRTLAASVVPLEKARVHAILDRLGIGERQWDYPAQLSTGQQQRVAIARGLISQQPILLADEPTSALDPATARHVTRLIIEQARAHRATLIFCTHWIQVALEYVDRVIGLRNGHVEMDARASDVTDTAIDSLYGGSREYVG